MAGWPQRWQGVGGGELGWCGCLLRWDIEGVECGAVRGLAGAGRGGEAGLPVIIGVLAFDIKSD